MKRYWGGFLALVLLLGLLPLPWAFADGGDFTIRFRAATPTTYDHSTGTGGAFGNVVTQLEGGDFACGDKVVFLSSIAVDGSPTAANQAVQLNFSFATDSTGQPGAGYRSLVSAGPNTSDPAHTANGTFPSSVNVVTNDFSGDPGLVNVQITGLEASEVFILRLVVELGCDPGESPTGNIQAALESAAVISPTPDAISGGQQTTPLMSAGSIAQPGIAITKTADAASVSAGDPIGFTIVVSNPGDAAATSVQMTDALPGDPGLDWSLSPAVTGCSITGAAGAEQLTCSFATLAAQASVTIHVTSPTTADSCGSVDNTAMVTTGNDGSAQASDSITVLCPDVTVVKTATPPIVTAPGSATFTIQVSNLGAGIARNVMLTDTLPAGTWSDDSTSCDIAGGILTCSFGNLAPNGTASVTLTRSVDTCATLVNTATVSAANEPQSAQGNNTSTATVTVICAQLSIAKTADTTPLSAGSQIGFTITVVNGGNAAATNVVVTDNLPGNTGLNWSLSPAVTGCAITGPLGSQVLNCTLPTVPADAGTVTIHVVSPTTPASCGTITNSASLATGDPAVATITVNCPDVTVVKTADNGTINAGETAAFTIVVTNLGPGTATAVTLNDPLPAGVTWSTSTAGCSISAGGVLSCSFGTLAPTETRTILVSGTTDAVDCGQLRNTASVAADNEPADTGNNSSAATITVNCPDVTVFKTADVTPISAGDAAAFTIVVGNLGPGAATNVTLTDTLPAGITWSTTTTGCSISVAGVLSCNFGTLAPGDERPVNVTGTTSSATCRVLENTATVEASNEPPANTQDNSSTATITVNCPDVMVNKTADNGTINAGETAAFTIVVRSVGAGTATTVTLDDPLPAGVTWSTSTAGCSISAGGVLSCSFGALGPNETRTIHVTGLTDTADCGVLTNTATVAADNEPADTGNNSSTATITVVCPAPGSITIKKVVDTDYRRFSFRFIFGDQTTTFQLGDGGSETFPNLAAGTYVIREIDPFGFDLESLTCNPEADVQVRLDLLQVTIELGPGENVVCTFVNERDSSTTGDPGDPEEETSGEQLLQDNNPNNGNQQVLAEAVQAPDQQAASLQTGDPGATIGIRELPRTGFSTYYEVLLGFVLVGLGLGMVLEARRRRPAAGENGS